MTTRASRPTVVLLHGLGRTARSMRRLRRRLESEGYATWARTYPSRRYGIRELADQLAARIRSELSGRELFAVTHSLGGILFRHMGDLPWRGAVLLAPPNGGSRLAAAFDRRTPWFGRILGPAARELARPGPWPVPPVPVGVIAGTRPTRIAVLLGTLPTDEEHDGVVTVSETRLEGMADFATVRAGHTFIMNDPGVRRQIIEFLRNGRFVR